MATERTVLVRLKADVAPFVRDLGLAAAAVRGLTNDIDTSNQRTAWLVQGFLALAPALVPLGAAATPILSGIVTQMTIGAAAAGVLALGLSGIGEGLKAVDKFQLEPTAANLQAMRIEMEQLGPAGADFVTFLDGIEPQLRTLNLAAKEGMLPGFEDGITSLLTKLPQFRTIVSQIAEGLGQLGREAGAGLSGPGFEDFFRFLRTDAQPILIQMGRTFGNFVEGLANMIVAFAPMSRDFSRGFLEMSRDFAAWSHGLEDSQSFQDFVAYVQESVPKAQDFLASLGDAFVQIVQAAAPVGDVLLPIFTTFLDIVAMLADTPIGATFIAIAAALAILGRTMALGKLATGGFVSALGGMGAALGLSRAAMGGHIGTLSTVISATDRATMSVAQLAAAQRALAANQALAAAALRRTAILSGAMLGGMALVATGAAESIGLQNTALFATMGLMAGPWGAALGGGIGLMMDFKAGQQASSEAASEFSATLDKQTGALTANSREWAVKELLDAGALADAKELGISLSDVTDAVLGQGDALAVLVPQLEALRDAEGKTVEGAKGGLEITPEGAREAERLLGVMEELGLVVKNGRGEFELTNEALGRHAAETEKVSSAYDLASRSAADFAEAVTRLNEILTGRASMRDYEEAIDAAAKALKKNGENLDINTQKGRDNAAALDAIAAKSLAVVEGMSKSNRIRFLQRAREDFLDAAEGFGMTARAADRLADRLGLIDRTTPKINVDISDAEGKVRRLGKLFNTLPDDVQTKIRTDGVPETEGQIDRLVKKYGLTEKQRNALVTLKDAASKPLGRVLALLDKTNRQKTNPIVDAHIDRAMDAFGKVLKKAQEVDRQKPNPKVTAETGAASSSLQNIINQIAAIKSKTVTITTNFVRTGGTKPGASAAGNFFPSVYAYAGGGMDMADRHRPEFALPGLTRIWREPETQGESYIPHANDWRRPNAVSVLEQTANLFGLTVQRQFAEGGAVWAREARKAMRFADGGMVQASRAPVGGYARVSSDSNQVTGRAIVELRTPWGTQEVEVLMSNVARNEYDADRDFERVGAVGEPHSSSRPVARCNQFLALASVVFVLIPAISSS